MIKNFILSLLLLSFLGKAKIYAQQGKVDPTFNTLDDGSAGDGFDNVVRTLLLQDDQNLLVGGDYLNLNGKPSVYLTRLKPDGTTDENFNTGTGFNGKIYASAIQSDGKIIVGGSFTSFNGINCGRLVRLNKDGSYDASFNTTIAVTAGTIYGISLQSDGKVFIVGSFTKYNNSTVGRVARLLSDGNLDTSFLSGSGALATISNVSILSGGKILLAGNFTSFNRIQDINKIVRLNIDGQIDTSFHIGTGFDGNVNTMAVQEDGKIVLAGEFTTYNGIMANRIIRVNSDGSIDTSFESGSGFSDGGVQTIKIDTLGNIMVGGSFTGNYNGTDVNRVCLLNANGILKSDIEFGSGPGSASVLALANDLEGAWYIGGSFSVFDGLNQGRLAKINAEGEYDTAYLSAGIGFDNSVLKVLSLEDQKTLVFGNFKKFNGAFASRIARLLEDGSIDLGFNAQQLGANNSIKTAVLQTDGKIICGGSFTKYNETTINRIVRILPNGIVDDTFNVGIGFDGQIYTMAIQSDQKIIIGGSFVKYNGLPAGKIVRLLPNGLRDTSFNVSVGVDGIVDSILIQPDGKVLISSRFTNVDGHLMSRLVRLNSDGSIDQGFNTGTGFDKYVYAIALQSDQKIILGGSFLTFNGSSQKRITRLNPNGSLDTTFESGSGFSKGDVRSILVQPDDRILVGGTFSGTYKNSTALRLVRLLKSGDFDTSFDAHLNNKLYSMSFTSNQRLMIGGDFNSVSGISKHRIARLKLCLDATTWNGTNWSNGLPSGGKEITFKEDYTSLTAANVCSCSIEEGKTVTLLSGNTLGIEFSYFGLGTLILEDKANLYQSDDQMINTGVINLKRNSSPILKYDYTYWASPVDNQKLVDLSPETLIDKYYSYDNVVRDWRPEKPSNKMIPGIGYIIRGPQYFSPAIPAKYEATFIGVPNNGKILVDAGYNTYNLIGNPYPSTLNADAFLKTNRFKITGALYFWTHNTPLTNYAYNSDDYATYNLLGGVGTRGALTSGLNEAIPDRTIASGQSFFVISTEAGVLEFNDNMRLIERNTTFFKQANNEISSSEDENERHRIWLNLKNNDGVFKQILLGYIDNATNSYDEEYDAEPLNKNQLVNFYSIVENKKLVIQGRALPFEDNDSIPLGFASNIAGNFNFSIDHADGLFAASNTIFIEDKDLKLLHNLTESPYSFSTQKGIFNDRLVIKFKDNTLKTDDFKNNERAILVAVKDKVIQISSVQEAIKEVTVFDILGKLIYNKKKIGATDFQISNFKSQNQILLVKTTLENGNATTTKIMF